MDLKICSLNVRGLGDRLKRREMFNWLRKKNYQIYMLQEVHCSENTIAVWSAEWGYKTLFSCCTSARGGVAILFNNNFNLQLQRSYSDPNVLPNLIDNDQTGFLKGRFIGENIRLIDSIIKYTAAKNILGLLLFLDFEKAFDTVEWSFLHKTLQHYNFGPSAIQWTCSVSTAFWQDFKQWAVNRGELSNTINLTAYLVLGLNLNKNKRLDFYMYFLIARFFLWVCKTRNTFPKIENFSPFLSHYDTPRTNT